MIDAQSPVANAGFANPVPEAQSVFRAVMAALARPGKIVPIATSLAAPGQLPTALAAIALTLADYETPLWLDDGLARDAEFQSFLAFQTGAPVTRRASEAALAFCLDAAELPRLDGFAQGTLEYPDRSTTIVAAVESLTDGEAMVIAGPGVNGSETIAPTPLPTDFRRQMRLNRGQFPCGIDLILVADDRILGLPRTVEIMEP